MIRSYSTVTVTTPGTPKRVTYFEDNPAEARGCHGVLIQAFPTNTGKIYIGTATLSRTPPHNGVMAFLAVPTVNSIPTFSAALTLAAAAVQLRDLYIDADNINDGVVVTVLIA